MQERQAVRQSLIVAARWLPRRRGVEVDSEVFGRAADGAAVAVQVAAGCAESLPLGCVASVGALVPWRADGAAGALRADAAVEAARRQRH